MQYCMAPGVVGPLSGKIAPLLPLVQQTATAKITAINRPIAVLNGATDVPAALSGNDETRMTN